MHKPYEALIKACIQQNPKAQREFYERFAPKMMGVCFRYARNRDDAEDMLQEGFVKIYQKLTAYKFQGSLEGWVRRIIVRTAIDMLRKQKHQQNEIDIDHAVGEEVAEDAIDNLELEYLYRIIQALPTGYRLVFNLYAIEGFSHAEIGDQLGITASTSRSQYTRARSILMNQIREDRMETNVYKDVS